MACRGSSSVVRSDPEPGVGPGVHGANPCLGSHREITVIAVSPSLGSSHSHSQIRSALTDNETERLRDNAVLTLLIKYVKK